MVWSQARESRGGERTYKSDRKALQWVVMLLHIFLCVDHCHLGLSINLTVRRAFTCVRFSVNSVFCLLLCLMSKTAMCTTVSHRQTLKQRGLRAESQNATGEWWKRWCGAGENHLLKEAYPGNSLVYRQLSALQQDAQPAWLLLQREGRAECAGVLSCCTCASAPSASTWKPLALPECYSADFV